MRELAPDFVDSDVVRFLLHVGSVRGGAPRQHRVVGAVRCALRLPFRAALERGWAEDGWEGAKRALIEVMAQVDGYSPV